MTDPKPLRSIFEPGTTTWAGRRAHWRALGLTAEEQDRPKIAIVNSSSDLAICFAHLDGIVPRLKQSIAAAGGVGLEVRTAAPSDFITNAGRAGKYILPTRDLIVNDIEVAVEGAQLDGIVCLASCDKTTPGQIMAGARLDIPTIIVPCGYQTSGRLDGEHVDIEDVFLGAGRVASGELTVERLGQMADVAVTGPGVCAGMGTANSMHIAAEALGMTVTGASPVRANSPRMWDSVRESGKRIVEMVAEGLNPRQVLTAASIRNAIVVMLSASASINSVKHLAAIAAEARVDIDVWAEFARLGPQVPLLIDVRPNGKMLISEFEEAGGTAALLRQLAPLLDLDAPTVTGTLRERVEAAEVRDEELIRPMSNPKGTQSTIVIVRGSLAPSGAIVKRAVVDRRPAQFRGEAIVFHSRDDAMEGLKDGKIRAGHVIVLSGIGPKGGPGMGFTSGFIFALEGAGLGEKTAVITDGQLSGLVNRGLVVGEVAPEAAAGGPLALVRDGDSILVDLVANEVNLEVPEEELSARTPELAPVSEEDRSSWLDVYARSVGSSEQGLALALPSCDC
jgi:dihydroxy-acid dehydratase